MDTTERLQTMMARSIELAGRKLVELGDKNNDVHEHGPQRTSDMSLMSAAALARTSRERELALERLGAGTYGLCIDCRADIDAARLEVRPQAIRCTGCALALERQMKR